MKTGMLWFDNDPKIDLGSKIVRASQYYRNKYGAVPNLCYVHPSMLTPDQNENPAQRQLAGVEVRSNQMVQPNHLWLGVYEVHGT